MPDVQTIPIEFPMRGVYRAGSIALTNPQYTIDCKNVWPIDPPSGRSRGGVRPGLNQLGGVASTPYNWCRVSYYDSGTKLGVAVTSSDGTHVSLDGSTWTKRITTTPGSLTFPNTASCAVYNGYIFQAKSGAAARQKQLPSGSEADLSNANGGTAPTKCGGVLAHGDRLWFYNQSDAPHIVYASAVGDFENWDTADPTSGAAFTNTGAEGGILGEPVVAGLSVDNNTVLFGGPTSIYAYRGNPKVSGAQKISDHIGPVMQSAWCKAADGYVYMITPNGPYRIPPGAGAPQPVGSAIPNELKGLNPYSGDKVAIGYDHRWGMIHVYVDPDGASDFAWAYWLPTNETPGGWFPMTVTPTIHLAVTFPELISDDTSSILPISSGGTAYQYDRTEDEDFDSYLFLGPFYMGDPGTEGILTAISAALAEGSDDVNWEIYTGRSAEAAYQSADPPTFASKNPHFSGKAWSVDDWNHWQHPRARGACFFLKLYDVANEQWLIESITAKFATKSLRRATG